MPGGSHGPRLRGMPTHPLPAGFRIRPAEADDVPVLLDLIRGLAEYERLSHEMSADEAGLRTSLFGKRRYAEAVIGEVDSEPVGFALYFHSYSTFLGKPGLYLEDLFVKPEHRGRGFGGVLLRHVGRIAVERDCGRLEWAVLDWNEPAIGFYRKLGAGPLDEWTTYRMTGEALRKLAEGAP